MWTTLLLILHVVTAIVGLVSGFLSMLLRKGSGLHGAAGTVFFASMLIATGAGAIVAGFLHPNYGNLMGSTLSFYLVATSWMAAKRRTGAPGPFDRAALLFILAVATAGAAWGFTAAAGPKGTLHGYPAPFFFVFGSIALLFAVADVRMLARGGIFGPKRIARHLVRMCLALLFALASFYPGQGDRFLPAWVRETNLAYVPHVLVAGAMFFWWYRVSARKRVPGGGATSGRLSDLPTPP